MLTDLTPEDLQRDGASYRWTDGDIGTSRVASVARISLPTRSVVLSDPAFLRAPGDATVIDGLAGTEAQLRLTTVRWERADHEDVVAVALTCGEGPVERWEELRDEEGPLGLSVDSGLGCVFDSSDLPAMRQLRADREAYLARLKPLRRSLAWKFPDEHEPIALGFKVSMGDGVYPVWKGWNASGDLVSILVDLELLWHVDSRVE